MISGKLNESVGVKYCGATVNTRLTKTEFSSSPNLPSATVGTPVKITVGVSVISASDASNRGLPPLMTADSVQSIRTEF